MDVQSDLFLAQDRIRTRIGEAQRERLAASGRAVEPDGLAEVGGAGAQLAPRGRRRTLSFLRSLR
jgi:hypothetical protein